MKKLTYLLGALAVMTVTACSASDNNAQKDDTTAQPTEQTAPTSWMPDSATVLPSGLGIVIENPGDSTRAGDTTPVTLNYTGRLTNGKVFDSSYDRGEPATFMAVQVVPGFGEGIKQIGRGGKATLYIPSDLAYGARGIPQAGIPANANLIFDIEIIDITPETIQR